MFYRVQIWIAIIICVMLISIINMVRREKIDLRYALSWILLALIALILDIFPQILWWMAYILGIELASNMVFIVAILFLVIKVYTLTASVSRLADKNKRLVQEIALLREEMKK